MKHIDSLSKVEKKDLIKKIEKKMLLPAGAGRRGRESGGKE